MPRYNRVFGRDYKQDIPVEWMWSEDESNDYIVVINKTLLISCL